MLQSRTNVVDTLVEYARFYKQFHSFIISFCLNAVNFPTPPPPPKSTLYCFSTGRLEGLKYNIDFGERGGGTQRQGIGYFIEVSQHFCPSLLLWLKPFLSPGDRVIGR